MNLNVDAEDYGDRDFSANKSGEKVDIICASYDDDVKCEPIQSTGSAFLGQKETLVQ
jgi:hypothetical protein